MYVLYLDESGNENNPSDRYFVLAGLALFERQIHYLNQRLKHVHEKHFPNQPPIPFHASAIRSGRKFWRDVSADKRQEILDDVIGAIDAMDDRRLRLYAAAIEKDAELYGEDAVEAATEQICKRFDTFLMRRYQEHDDPQRGLLIFSEGRFDARAKLWVRGFRRRGTRWGSLNNLADIPYFAPMKESRLLQAADFVAHATWLSYERRDHALQRRLLRHFDQRDGVIHGLVHVGRSRGRSCNCPPCASRRTPGNLGWISSESS
jgi:hypothetical protein